MNISHLIILYEAAKCRGRHSGSCPRFVEDRSRIFPVIPNKMTTTIIINAQPNRIIAEAHAVGTAKEIVKGLCYLKKVMMWDSLKKKKN